MPHIHEKIDFTASVYIVHEDAVLLRMHDKYGLWAPPGGHIELDEDPNQAAIREVMEETGLTVQLAGAVPQFEGEGNKELIPPRFLNIHQITPDSSHYHCDMIYLAESNHRTLTPREEEKATEMHWFTREDLTGDSYVLRENVRHYALTALDELSS